MINTASAQPIEVMPSGEAYAAVGTDTAASAPSLRYFYAKRCLDLTLTLVALILLVPVMLVVALIIVLDSGRPVFYRQERVGARLRRRGGQVEWVQTPFSIIKFRTMVPEADSCAVHQQFVEAFVKGEPEPNRHGDEVYKLSNDARVTRAGRSLRATSLDELPQLFNVLTGSMSLVGPRPVPLYEVALYQPPDRERLAGLPGITGPWQVHGRGRVGFEEMMRMDIEYVREQSIRRDLSLLVKTIPAVLSRGGAR